MIFVVDVIAFCRLSYIHLTRFFHNQSCVCPGMNSFVLNYTALHLYFMNELSVLLNLFFYYSLTPLILHRSTSLPLTRFFNELYFFIHFLRCSPDIFYRSLSLSPDAFRFMQVKRVLWEIFRTSQHLWWLSSSLSSRNHFYINCAEISGSHDL